MKEILYEYGTAILSAIGALAMIGILTAFMYGANNRGAAFVLELLCAKGNHLAGACL